MGFCLMPSPDNVKALAFGKSLTSPPSGIIIVAFLRGSDQFSKSLANNKVILLSKQKTRIILQREERIYLETLPDSSLDRNIL